MMTYEEQFEKQFPSLPRKDFMLFSDEEELLMKNCLDKQRVENSQDPDEFKIVAWMKDLHDMRRFQSEFMRVDHELRDFKQRVIEAIDDSCTCGYCDVCKFKDELKEKLRLLTDAEEELLAQKRTRSIL